jgi:Na+/H+ antiporter NhaA
LPIIAAFGGVIVPALIYTFFNTGQPSQNGWGIPMATDIAFVIGCVPISLDGIGGDNTIIVLAVTLGLFLGKPIGVFTASWLAVRSGIAVLPSGVTWGQMFGDFGPFCREQSLGALD